MTIVTAVMIQVKYARSALLDFISITEFVRSAQPIAIVVLKEF
jgi:hypothetical protein